MARLLCGPALSGPRDMARRCSEMASSGWPASIKANPRFVCASADSGASRAASRKCGSASASLFPPRSRMPRAACASAWSGRRRTAAVNSSMAARGSPASRYARPSLKCASACPGSSDTAFDSSAMASAGLPLCASSEPRLRYVWSRTAMIGRLATMATSPAPTSPGSHRRWKSRDEAGGCRVARLRAPLRFDAAAAGRSAPGRMSQRPQSPAAANSRTIGAIGWR